MARFFFLIKAEKHLPSEILLRIFRRVWIWFLQSWLPFANSLCLASSEREAFLPDILQMGSCNAPASWFYILRRPVVSLTTWNTDRTNSALLVCISTSSQDSADYNLPDNSEVASTSTSAQKAKQRLCWMRWLSEWWLAQTCSRHSALFMPTSSAVELCWAPVFRGRLWRGNSNQKQMKRARGYLREFEPDGLHSKVWSWLYHSDASLGHLWKVSEVLRCLWSLDKGKCCPCLQRRPEG